MYVINAKIPFINGILTIVFINPTINYAITKPIIRPIAPNNISV